MEQQALKEQLQKLYGIGEVFVVACNQWGDTGKGAVVDRLMMIAHICVRSTGADNCGHTIEVGGKKYVTHMIPSGIIFDAHDVVSIIARDVAFNPLTARLELEQFLQAGITHNNLKISFRAKLIMPYHILFDMLSEARASQDKKIGTTGRGVGPVFQDHVGRNGLIVLDLANPARMRDKIYHVIRDRIAFLKTLDHDMVKEIMYHERLEHGQFYHPINLLDVEAIVDRYVDHGSYFASMICDAESYIQSQLGKKTIVFEGAQGALLDINQGSYPFVTSSRCTVAGLADGAGLHVKDVTQAFGVVKAYMTRVGEGSFPTEIGGRDAVSVYSREMREKMAHIPLIEQINSSDPIVCGGALGIKGFEFGATTGRPRRTGWMDLVALRYAISINGPKIIITKLDILTGLKKIPICVQYRYMGADNPFVSLRERQRFDAMIAEEDVLRFCDPVYEYFDGWDEDISGVRAWEDLPHAARKYLHTIEEKTGAKIVMIGVGPNRDQTFFV